MTHKKTFQAIAGIPAVLLVLIFPALAQEVVTRPLYFQVTGVAQNDVLNVRARPDAGSGTVGAFANNSGPIEVLRIEDGWAQVALAEGMGWVSAHFLTEVELPAIGKTALPEGLSCGGTEPFWNLVMAGEEVNYSAMDAGGTSLGIFDSGQFANVGGTLSFVLAQASGLQFTGIVSDQLCWDGMSDRTYPRRIELLLSSPEGTLGQSGCCNMPVMQ